MQDMMSCMLCFAVLCCAAAGHMSAVSCRLTFTGSWNLIQTQKVPKGGRVREMSGLVWYGLDEWIAVVWFAFAA